MPFLGLNHYSFLFYFPGQLVPEAMVAYLDNHGPEKFATIFLGKSMTHIVDFFYVVEI